MKNTLEIIYQKHDFFDILKKHAVVFVSGSTGCGKSTQIPKFLNEFYGDKVEYFIGMTQPRRIAAVGISNRINEEYLLEFNENNNTNNNNNNNKVFIKCAAHQIMYENTTTKNTRIKIMTEGILLKEIYGDNMLEKYDCIVLDEIHERSTNFDLILLFLTRILKKRNKTGSSFKKFKIVLMSATMDKEMFADLFGKDDVGYFDVDVKKHKVNVFYEYRTPKNFVKAIHEKILKIEECEREFKDIEEYFEKNDKKEDKKEKEENFKNKNEEESGGYYYQSTSCYGDYKKTKLTENFKKEEMHEVEKEKEKEIVEEKEKVTTEENIIKEKVTTEENIKTEKVTTEKENNFKENTTETNTTVPPNNTLKFKSILVFLPSKKDIYFLKRLLDQDYMNYSVSREIIALHSGLSKEDQDKIFTVNSPKIILATNIAETSITVPDIFYVIDSGKVKNKYVFNTTVTYKEEWISKHSAIQRMGRAGRVAPGVCFRMYSGTKYESFDTNTIPQSNKETPEEVLYALHNFIEGGTREKIHKMIKKMFAYTDDQLMWAYWSLHRCNLISLNPKNDNEVTVVDPTLFSLPLSSFYAKCFAYAKTLNLEQDVFRMVVVGICILQLGIEIGEETNREYTSFNSKKENDIRYEYYESDFVMYVHLFSKWLVRDEEYYNMSNINNMFMSQVDKLSKKLLRGDNYFVYTKEKASAYNTVITSFFTFNVAQSVYDNEYVFDNKKVYLCPRSVVNTFEREKRKYVVFEFIQISRNEKLIIKNVSVAKEEYISKSDKK